MTLPAFDTHAFIKKLTAAGMPMPQAEAQVEFQNQVLSELVTEKLATKEDILRVELKLESKIDLAVTDIKAHFKLLYWIGTFLLGGVVTILFKLFHS